MRRYLYILLLILSGSPGFGQDQPSIVAEGRYLGKNIYVQNPFDGQGHCCCVQKVYVNDQEINIQTNSTAFEIDLSSLNLDLQDPYKIKIVHRSDCLPKFLGPELITPKCAFNATKIEVLGDSLHWYTQNEQTPMTFIVEQYRWNKWLRVGTVDGLGPNEEDNHYSCAVSFHFGQNRFRVKQIDYSGKPCMSPIAEIDHQKTTVSFEIINDPMTISFSEQTMYELFDAEGNILKKGNAIKVDCSTLKKKNTYWLNFGHVTGQKISFKKRIK